MMFREWLKLQEGRDDAIGELARIVRDDREPTMQDTMVADTMLSSYKAWKAYVHQIDKCDNAIQVLNEAWREYTGVPRRDN
jgi:hypothetical protein